jgi:hypothetical protein
MAMTSIRPVAIHTTCDGDAKLDTFRQVANVVGTVPVLRLPYYRVPVPPRRSTLGYLQLWWPYKRICTANARW